MWPSWSWKETRLAPSSSRQLSGGGSSLPRAPLGLQCPGRTPSTPVTSTPTPARFQGRRPGHGLGHERKRHLLVRDKYGFPKGCVNGTDGPCLASPLAVCGKSD